MPGEAVLGSAQLRLSASYSPPASAGDREKGRRALGFLLKSMPSRLTFTECPPVTGTVLSPLQTCVPFYKPQHPRDFPGGAVVKNPPANAGDMGSSPGLGRSHMPRSN